MLTLNSNSLLVRTKSNATAICQCRPVRGLYPTASYTSTDAHNGLCRRAPGLLPSHRRWRSALRHVAVNAKSSEQGSRAELAADRPSQGLQQLPQPEIRDTKPSRVFLSHIPKRLRAALLGLAVAVPVLLCRPAPAHAQRPEDGHGLPVTARIDSNYGASSSGRLLAERALRRHRSASDGTIGQGAPLHLYSSNNVIIGDLAALSGPDDGISGPAYGLGPTLSAGDADNDLTAQELQTVQMFQQQRSSIVNVTHMRSMQSFQTLDVHKQPFGQGSGFIWDTRGHIVTSYRLCKGAGEMKVRAWMDVPAALALTPRL